MSINKPDSRWAKSIEEGVPIDYPEVHCVTPVFCQTTQLEQVSRDREELTERLRLLESVSAERDDQLTESQSKAQELQQKVLCYIISLYYIILFL